MMDTTLNDVLRAGRPVLMDGALGTELLRLAPPPVHRCNRTHADAVLRLYEAYLAAGAECVLTNTFLIHHDDTPEAEALARAGVRLTRSAAGPGCCVLAAIGPVGARDGHAPIDRLCRLLPTFDGVDGLLLETQVEPAAVGQLLDRLPAAGWMRPVLVSFAFRRAADRLVTCAAPGAPVASPEEVARWAETRRPAVTVLGVNCGVAMGPADVAEVLQRYREVTDLPLLARPNAGTPVATPGGPVYPLSPASFAAMVPALLAAGARLIGGCCGTTPDHIRALRDRLGSGPACPPDS